MLDSARFPALSLMPSCPVLMRVSGVCPRVWYGESGFDIRAKASAGPAAGARVQLHVLMVGVISVLVKLTFPHALMTARRVQQDSASRKAGRKRKALLELLDQVENIVQTRSPEPPSECRQVHIRVHQPCLLAVYDSIVTPACMTQSTLSCAVHQLSRLAILAAHLAVTQHTVVPAGWRGAWR